MRQGVPTRIRRYPAFTAPPTFHHVSFYLLRILHAGEIKDQLDKVLETYCWIPQDGFKKPPSYSRFSKDVSTEHPPYLVPRLRLLKYLLLPPTGTMRVHPGWSIFGRSQGFSDPPQVRPGVRHEEDYQMCPRAGRYFEATANLSRRHTQGKAYL